MSNKRMRNQGVRVRHDTKRELRANFLNNSLEGGISLSEMKEGRTYARNSPKPSKAKRNLERQIARTKHKQAKHLAEVAEFRALIGADKQVKKSAKSGKPNLG